MLLYHENYNMPAKVHINFDFCKQLLYFSLFFACLFAFCLAVSEKCPNFALAMRYNTNVQGEWEHLTVSQEQPLLEFLLANVQQSRTKIKQTLQGQGIKVNGKTVTQFDYLLQPGMKVAVSKTKRNHPSPDGGKSRKYRI